MYDHQGPMSMNSFRSIVSAVDCTQPECGFCSLFNTLTIPLSSFGVELTTSQSQLHPSTLPIEHLHLDHQTTCEYRSWSKVSGAIELVKLPWTWCTLCNCHKFTWTVTVLCRTVSGRILNTLIMNYQNATAKSAVNELEETWKVRWLPNLILNIMALLNPVCSLSNGYHLRDLVVSQPCPNLESNARYDTPYVIVRVRRIQR